MAVLFVVIALLTAFVPVAGFAQGNKTYFEGTSCGVADLNEGIWTELGNGAYRVVGLQQQYREETNDPRTTGDNTVTVNMILDLATGSGPLWGTFHLINDQGSWSGHFNGRLDNWAGSLRATGHGGGAYEGLVARWIMSRPDPSTCYEMSGYIVETGAGNVVSGN
jgi:hypothetical protein